MGSYFRSISSISHLCRDEAADSGSSQEWRSDLRTPSCTQTTSHHVEKKKVYTVHYFCESTAMLKFFGISAQNEAWDLHLGISNTWFKGRIILRSDTQALGLDIFSDFFWYNTWSSNSVCDHILSEIFWVKVMEETRLSQGVIVSQGALHSCTRHLDFPWDVQYGFCTFSTFKREDLRTNWTTRSMDIWPTIRDVKFWLWMIVPSTGEEWRPKKSSAYSSVETE